MRHIEFLKLMENYGFKLYNEDLEIPKNAEGLLRMVKLNKRFAHYRNRGSENLQCFYDTPSYVYLIYFRLIHKNIVNLLIIN